MFTGMEWNRYCLNMPKRKWVMFSNNPIDTGRKLNVLCAFSLFPVSTGRVMSNESL